MKPGKNDKQYKIRIAGLELAVLQSLTPMMSDAFGLDDKIDAYKGTRAITLYAWDLDCLEDVLSMALSDPPGHEIETEAELTALKLLDERLRKLRFSGEDA